MSKDLERLVAIGRVPPARIERNISGIRFVARFWRLALVATLMELTCGIPAPFFSNRWWSALWDEHARIIRAVSFR